MERNIVLFGDVYEKSFLSRSMKEGYIEPITDYYLSNLIHEIDYVRTYKNLRHQTASLQMFLLFEEVVLVNPDILGYEYKRLENTGFFKVISIENESAFSGSLKWDGKLVEQAIIYKDIIVSSLIKKTDKVTKYYLKKYRLSTKQFWSTVFDMCFLESYDTIKSEYLAKVQFFIEDKAKETLTLRGNYEFWRNNVFGPKMIYDQLCLAHYQMVLMATGTFLKMLEFSSFNDCVLLQKEFDITKGYSRYSKRELLSGNDILHGYQIVRVTYEKLISALPKLSSIEDVLRMKDKRRKEIRRLRQVIFHLESEIKGNKHKRITKVAKDIAKASRELSRGLTLSKVSKWTTYLSLPIGVVESLLGIPPVLGLSVGLLGVSSTYNCNEIEKNNSWIQVIR